MKILSKFKEFLKENGNQDTFYKVSSFFVEEKEVFEKEAREKYQKKGLEDYEVNAKVKFDWIYQTGAFLEEITMAAIEDFCDNRGCKIVSREELVKPSPSDMSKELDRVKRDFFTHFGERALLPTSDLILYNYDKNDLPRILAVFSIRNYFDSERVTETPYWKLKLSQSNITKNIQVYLISSDENNDISFRPDFDKGSSRIIVEYELDGIYLAKENFHASSKVKSLQELLLDLEKLL